MRGIPHLMRVYRLYVVLSVLSIFIAETTFLAHSQTVIPVSPIAVIPFASLPGGKEMPWMSQAIADTIIAKLGKIQGLKVLERAQVEKALEELALERQGVVEKDKAAQVGRFIGAKGIVIGSYVVTSDGFLHIAARLVLVESSEVLAGEQVTGEVRNAGDVFRAIEQLALRLSERMGYKLTERERQAMAVVPTESIPALEAKTLAQTALNKGKEEEALAQVKKALEEDPEYREAREMESYIFARLGRWFFNSSVILPIWGFKTPWNPAALASTHGVTLTGSVLTYKLLADDEPSVDQIYHTASLTLRLLGFHVGFSYAGYSWSFEHTGGRGDERGDGYALSIALPFGSRLSLGASLKFIQHTLLGHVGTASSFDVGLELASAAVTVDVLARDLPSLRKKWASGWTDVFTSAIEGLIRIKLLDVVFLQGELQYEFYPIPPREDEGVGGSEGAITAKAGVAFFIFPFLGLKAGILTYTAEGTLLQLGYLVGAIVRVGGINVALDVQRASNENTRSTRFSSVITSGLLSITF